MTQFRFDYELSEEEQRVFDAVHADLRRRTGARITTSHVARFIFTGSLGEMTRQRRNEPVGMVLGKPGVEVVEAVEPVEAVEAAEKVAKKAYYSDEWLQPKPGIIKKELEFYASVPEAGFGRVSPGQKSLLDDIDRYYENRGWKKYLIHVQDAPGGGNRPTVLYWCREVAAQEGVDPPDWDDGCGREFVLERFGTTSPHVQAFPGAGVVHILPYDWGLGA